MHLQLSVLTLNAIDLHVCTLLCGFTLIVPGSWTSGGGTNEHVVDLDRLNESDTILP